MDIALVAFGIINTLLTFIMLTTSRQENVLGDRRVCVVIEEGLRLLLILELLSRIPN